MRVAALVQQRRSVGRVTGVGKFIANAPAALARCGHDVRLMVAHDEATTTIGPPTTILPYRRRTLEWGGAWLGWPRVDVDADWLWCPSEAFAAVRGAPLAITAHSSDWAEPTLPWANEWRYTRLRLRWRAYYRTIVRCGARVLTVSEFLRRRLMLQVGIPGDRIYTVGHGVEDAYFQVQEDGLPAQFDSLKPYVLVVGGLSVYKGGDRVLRVAERMPNLRFLVAGDGRLSETMPNNLVTLGYVDVAAGLPALYANAVAMLFLSRYETFGVPAAEAMAAGTPVVVSDAGALPEVVGDAGIVVPGDDVDAIVSELSRLSRDSSARTELIARGRDRAEKYRWERTGRRIAAALECRS